MITRRTALGLTAAGVAGVAAPARAQNWLQRLFGGDAPLGYDLPAQPSDHGLYLKPTPACDDGAGSATVSQTAGPFYSPMTPRRTSLLDGGIEGRRLVLVGRVVDTQCRLLPGAVLDFWQADTGGAYDNDGFRLRGHQFADVNGVYRLETIKPAAYGGSFFRRTPHIHVKVQGPGTGVLTTQLYFPDEAEQNADDSIFRDALLVDLDAAGDGTLQARFDFVLQATS